MYAIKTDGHSMNRADVNGKQIDDGDYVLVDSEAKSARSGDIVVAIIDNKATIKRIIFDKANDQIVLRAESALDYDPIYLHADDDFTLSGKVVGVIKKAADVKSKSCIPNEKRSRLWPMRIGTYRHRSANATTMTPPTTPWDLVNSGKPIRRNANFKPFELAL